MTTINATGVEYTFTEGTSNKYWRAFIAGTTVVTHYGRIGTLGQVTVHHAHNTYAAQTKYDDLRWQKQRKGYEQSARAVSFAVSDALLASAASTNHTGNGGSNSGLAYAVVAYYVDAALSHQQALQAEDPIQSSITSGTMTAQRAALGALVGYKVTDAALLHEDLENLSVMAGLLSLEDSLPRPAELVA